MPDREKVIRAYECVITRGKSVCECGKCDYHIKDSAVFFCDNQRVLTDVLALLKEQEKKQITLHKKHVITWKRDDTFSMRNLYEAICEELLDEGELFVARTDDHEKVDFVFYVTEGR